MTNSHLYIFSDSCPSDQLNEGDEAWHTIVNFVFQISPKLQHQVDSGKKYYEVLAQDSVFSHLTTDLRVQLSSNTLRKWNTGPSYKARFCKAFSTIQSFHKPRIAALSFQEKTLRNSKNALLRSFNDYLGGCEGRGIGFEEFLDSKSRLRMRHSFINFYGFQEIEGLEKEVLIHILMAWFIAAQYFSYRKEIIDSNLYGFNQLGVTVISDKLSGNYQKYEQNLRNLIDPEGEQIPIVVTRSPESAKHPGDLLADNLAGWLNTAIRQPAGEFAQYVKDIADSGVWDGWRKLLPSTEFLETTPAMTRLNSI